MMMAWWCDDLMTWWQANKTSGWYDLGPPSLKLWLTYDSLTRVEFRDPSKITHLLNIILYFWHQWISDTTLGSRRDIPLGWFCDTAVQGEEEFDDLSRKEKINWIKITIWSWFSIKPDDAGIIPQQQHRHILILSLWKMWNSERL